MEDVLDATTAVSDPLQTEAESAFHVLKVAFRENFFVKDISFIKLKDPH